MWQIKCVAVERGHGGSCKKVGDLEFVQCRETEEMSTRKPLGPVAWDPIEMGKR